METYKNISQFGIIFDFCDNPTIINTLIPILDDINALLVIEVLQILEFLI